MLKKLKWLNEIISIPIGIAAFILYPYLAMQIEDNPAVWGVGTLQKLVFAFALFNIANGLAGLTVKFVVPNIFNFKDDDFETAFLMTTPFQKCVLLLAWFAVYFFGYILSATAL